MFKDPIASLDISNPNALADATATSINTRGVPGLHKGTLLANSQALAFNQTLSYDVSQWTTLNVAIQSNNLGALSYNRLSFSAGTIPDVSLWDIIAESIITFGYASLLHVYGPLFTITCNDPAGIRVTIYGSNYPVVDPHTTNNNDGQLDCWNLANTAMVANTYYVLTQRDPGCLTTDERFMEFTIGGASTVVKGDLFCFIPYHGAFGSNAIRLATTGEAIISGANTLQIVTKPVRLPKVKYEIRFRCFVAGTATVQAYFI